MSEISNKTLVGLLVVAIVISLAGTFISLNKLGQLRSITGFQANVTTQAGTTSAQILGTAQITLYNQTMSFGSGQVNGTYSGGHDLCSLQTNAEITSSGNTFTGLGSGGKSPECVGTGWLTPYSFVVENTGNTDFTNVTLGTTGGNTGFQQNFSSSVTNGSWSYRFDEEVGACTESEGGYVTVPSAVALVCSSFAAQGDDAFLIQMNITLPEDAAAASWSDTVTFTGNV